MTLRGALFLLLFNQEVCSLLVNWCNRACMTGVGLFYMFVVLAWDLAQQLPATGQYIFVHLFVSVGVCACMLHQSNTSIWVIKHMGGQPVYCGVCKQRLPIKLRPESFTVVKSTNSHNLNVFNHTLDFHFASSWLMVRMNSNSSRLLKAHNKHSCSLLWSPVLSYSDIIRPKLPLSNTLIYKQKKLYIFLVNLLTCWCEPFTAQALRSYL